MLLRYLELTHGVSVCSLLRLSQMCIRYIIVNAVRCNVNVVLILVEETFNLKTNANIKRLSVRGGGGAFNTFVLV